MQWEIFNKFLAKLEEHSDYVFIGSEIDYRRLIAERSINEVSTKQLQSCISLLSDKLLNLLACMLSCSRTHVYQRFFIILILINKS